MVIRVEMISPASPGTALVPGALVERFKAQGWSVVKREAVRDTDESVISEPLARRGPGRPKKK